MYTDVLVPVLYLLMFSLANGDYEDLQVDFGCARTLFQYMYNIYIYTYIYIYIYIYIVCKYSDLNIMIKIYLIKFTSR